MAKVSPNRLTQAHAAAGARVGPDLGRIVGEVAYFGAVFLVLILLLRPAGLFGGRR
jgi:hypothetical protein